MSIFTSPLLELRRAERRCADRRASRPSARPTRGRSRTSRSTSRPDRRARCARARSAASSAALLHEVVDDHLVGLDDAGEAARLDRHVGERRALVERQRARCRRRRTRAPCRCPRPLLKNGWLRMWSITSFAQTPRAEPAAQDEARRLGHGDAHVAREPRVGHVGRADAEREAAERARHARVRVGARDDLPGERDLLDHLVVADGLRADELAVALDLAVELDARALREVVLHRRRACAPAPSRPISRCALGMMRSRNVR